MTKKYPVIDNGRCSRCLGCVGVAPDVFSFNDILGVMEVVDLVKYPEKEVDEAIKNCPRDCISWETVFL